MSDPNQASSLRLVELLRSSECLDNAPVRIVAEQAVLEAADEIERLRAALVRIEAQSAPHGSMTIREASDLARATLTFETAP